MIYDQRVGLTCPVSVPKHGFFEDPIPGSPRHNLQMDPQPRLRKDILEKKNSSASRISQAYKIPCTRYIWRMVSIKFTTSEISSI